ncbi:T9SS type A sorting domain-containing protein [Hymenobacter sedentarius]|uniref:Ig-like domain-containing protein n=1 Tax=Hymenobacter sedentarius TaxID=1411621 RepID=UPI0012FE3EF7|nr:T9SS type A sorting domain-containing protein [Hymenobacter sedentarius]
MKKLHSLLSCLGLLLLLTPFYGFGQCSNQITLDYYNNGTFVAGTSTNNGQSGYTASICPVAGAMYTFDGYSSSNAIITWSKVITKGVLADHSDDVLQNIISANLVAGNKLSLSVELTTSTIYRLKADSKNYPTGNCNKIDYVYLTLNPALTLTSNLTSVGTGICANDINGVTLTASGATDGKYTWSAPGVTTKYTTSTSTDPAKPSSLVVFPTTTTTYTVTATTSCGTSSQQITVPVKEVTVSPSAPVICSGQSTTLTASYSGASATYQWFVKGASTPISSSNSVSVNPTATTTYQVVATTTDCSTITKEVTVTVGTPTVAIAPSAVTACSGNSTTLTASSNNPAATYSWTSTTGGTTTALPNTTAAITVSPTATTTYTVTATTPNCGTATDQRVVTVVQSTAVSNTATASPAAICSGGSTTLTATSNITGATYQWYKTTDLGTIISTASSFDVSPTQSTTYRVFITTPCTSAAPLDVPVSVGTGVAVTPSQQTIDFGGSTTLTASGSTNGLYSWMASVKNSATGTSTDTPIASTAASITVTPAYTTTYTVTGTTATGGCNTAQSTVTVLRPLPVELISFEAVKSDKVAVLTWATASEKNSAYFEIERSFDGESFESVGQRAGAGTTSARTNYQFVDTRLAQSAGTVYYRLRQVDATGETNYSPVRALQSSATARAIKAEVFPNPFDKTVTVQYYSLGTDAVTLTVRNVLGQTVLTQTVSTAEGVQEIKLSDAASLTRGMYYLTIRQGTQQQAVRISRQ